MTPLEFLKCVWPDEGWYALATPTPYGYSHAVFDTIEKAARFAERYGPEKDVFFCVHTLKQERLWNPKKG